MKNMDSVFIFTNTVYEFVSSVKNLYCLKRLVFADWLFLKMCSIKSGKMKTIQQIDVSNVLNYWKSFFLFLLITYLLFQHSSTILLDQEILPSLKKKLEAYRKVDHFNKIISLISSLNGWHLDLFFTSYSRHIHQIELIVHDCLLDFCPNGWWEKSSLVKIKR